MEPLLFECLQGKHGLEISGPSDIFAAKGDLPLYPLVGMLDCLSFPRASEWGGRELQAGRTYIYAPGKEAGEQFVGDAVDLSSLPADAYDFLLASHVLEHIANPLRALQQWIRVVRAGGELLLVVPHYEGTFDRRRPVTKLAHLQDDFMRGVGEDDQTHWREIILLSERQGRLKWLSQNHLHRGVHHHVFHTQLVVEIFDYLSLQILFIRAILPFHIVIMGRKLAGQAQPDNRALLTLAEYLRQSPFLADRALLARGLNQG